ncbi:tyrosine-type recombinase/integrase [Flectobacillus roseus]|uniref:Phage integrase SAM-like domain-containing protein n=1 Tax=Flectobacillus roseus TaxID=502259 RepID=A0ABT6Y323_9BACT|nr:phage integrase SAM-like domain-containing protein [Flectobacillus roseus]MDI9857972.1 phage integrase SAM-like domain-containing protein [Flectobacillus roseus]
MLSFYYWFREGKTKDVGSISCVIQVDGEKSVPISTKIKLNRKQWNPKEQCFQGKEAAKNQKLMDYHELRFTQIYTEISFEKPNEPIRPDEILLRHRVASGRERKVKKVFTFVDVFKEFINDQNQLVKAGKLKQVSVASKESKFETIKSYLIKKSLEQIRIDEIDHVFLEDFKFYLKISKYEDSTIEKYLFLIKGVVKYAVSKGYTKERKIEEYRVDKAKAKDPVSLTQEELDKIDKMDLNENHRKTFDIYRFCAETSLSFTDYDTLCDEDIEMDSDNTLWIKLERDKTETRQSVPLNEKAMEIFNKYGSDVKTLPKMSNSKLNVYIKEIAKKANINKYLTFHTSRKSFVDHSINELDLPESTIKAMVGWKDSRQLSRYARVKDSTIKKQFLK